MSAPLVSWKRQPPEAPEEAATARLLEAVGDAPTLSREAAARIRSGVHGGGKSGRGSRGRSKPLSLLEPRISLLAAGLALLAILAALIAFLLVDPPAKAPQPIPPAPKMELPPGGEPSH